MTQTRNLSPVRCEPPDPPFDVDEQPEIENERLGVEREWGVGDLRFLQCLSPITVYRENSRLGNKWDKNYFGDGTNEYRYETQDGSFYEKHRDESADLLSSRGYGKHYPAASRNAPETG